MALITHIKKSDGRLEPINFDKLNKWVIYVDDNSNSWTSVVLETMKRINRTTEVETIDDKTFITSKQLQNELIQTYLNHNTHKSSIKAGRLWLPMLAKDVNNNFYDKKGENVTHRHIKDLHKEYAYKGLMDIDFVNSFTDAEYDYINNLLSYEYVHKYLNRFTYYQIQQLMNKYAIDENELPQYIFMRVAMSVEKGNSSKDMLFYMCAHIGNLFYMFIANKINIPTPYFTNAGKKTANYNSCCVYTTKDDVSSLAVGDHIAYTMTYSSAGIGSNILSRSIGEDVKGGSFKHQGKLPYYRSVVSATQANTQKGRGGSVTITYYCFDPEWETIQALKNPLTPSAKQIRNADYSMAYNTFFAKKVAEDAEIALFSPKNAPEIYENMGADIETFTKLYETAVKENRYHSFANARDIVLGALKQGIETGRHYYINLTETNRHTPFKDVIRQSNLCMTGDQYVISNHGLKTVKELYDMGCELELFDGEKIVKSSPMKLRERNQDVYKITLKNGMTHTVTDYHKVMTDKGLVECKNLSIGDKIKINTMNSGLFGNVDMVDEAFLLGLYLGDGTQTDDYICIDVWENKTDVLKDEILDTYKRVRTKYTNDEYNVVNQTGKVVGVRKYTEPKFTFCDVKTGNCIKKWRLQSTILKSILNFEKGDIPDWIMCGTFETQISFIKGLFYTDGTFSINEKSNSLYLSITQTNLEFLKKVQIMLNNMGLNFVLFKNSDGGLKLLPNHKGGNSLYNTKPTYRLVSGSLYVCTEFERMTGFISFRNKQLPEPIKQLYKPKSHSKVLSIEYVGKEDVYCPTVKSKEHLFVCNGIVTMNCQEIAIPTKGYNLITELYEPKQKEEFGEVGLCSLAGLVIQNIKDDDEYFKCAYYALRCIHHAIHNSNYVFNSVADTAKSRNSAGVGIVGLAHYLAKRGLKYDTLDGLNEIHKVSERHYYMLVKASLEMSKDFGVAEYIDKTKWVDGWLPINTYNRNTDKLHNSALKYDWENLRDEIKRNGGIHNSVLVAHMPAESSSLSSGTTNGIYPIRRKTLIKNSGTDSLRYVVPDDELDYQNAYDISVSDMKKVYAIVQKFTDQAISADEFLSMKSGKKVTTNELLQNFFVDVNYGNKTRYYVNQEISNVSINNGDIVQTQNVQETEELETSDCCSL